MQENEKFEKEDAKLAEEMQAWLAEEKYILLESRTLITFLRVNARINAVEKPSIWIRGLECGNCFICWRYRCGCCSCYNKNLTITADRTDAITAVIKLSLRYLRCSFCLFFSKI